MKKCTFILMIAVHSSLAAFANNGDPSPQQKEPEKKNEARSTKILSKGYFNIFELLLAAPEPKDTTDKPIAVPVKES